MIALKPGGTVKVGPEFVTVLPEGESVLESQQLHSITPSETQGQGTEDRDDLSTLCTENPPTLKSRTSRRRQNRTKGKEQPRDTRVFEYLHVSLETTKEQLINDDPQVLTVGTDDEPRMLVSAVEVITKQLREAYKFRRLFREQQAETHMVWLAMRDLNLLTAELRYTQEDQEFGSKSAFKEEQREIYSSQREVQDWEQLEKRYSDLTDFNVWFDTEKQKFAYGEVKPMKSWMLFGKGEEVDHTRKAQCRWQPYCQLREDCQQHHPQEECEFGSGCRERVCNRRHKKLAKSDLQSEKKQLDCDIEDCIGVLDKEEDRRWLEDLLRN